MDAKVPKDKRISRSTDWENLIYVREMESKTVHEDKKEIDGGKRSKTLSKVKPVKNISKNLQSFLEISPM